MERLPSAEERQWLVGALRSVLAARGAELLDAVPLVEPTEEWFPEPWDTTAAHAHRLMQRLMHYAGLAKLRLTLSAYDPEVDDAWDKGTAGWFAGIEDGRAHFGLHVTHFADPEAAAGVLAHEVAHAWRTHHRLVVDDRDDEELLTDVTTIVLGFGILSTNNTDRYRSSGDWSQTTWSISSTGYLPPQAMAYLLALWVSARDNDGERKIVERHLEPNQLAFFRAAMDALAKENVRARLGAGVRVPLREPARFVPAEPRGDEIREPEYVPPNERNRGEQVYRKAYGQTGWHLYLGWMPGAAIGFVMGMSMYESEQEAVWLAVAMSVVTMIMAFMHSRRSVCSACNAPAKDGVAICTGCGGMLGPRVTEHDLERLRLEELDRKAASAPFVDCDACLPEEPCERHADVAPAGGEEDEEEEEEEERVFVSEPRRAEARPTFGRRVAAVAAVAVIAALALAWWRQNHVAVYFDNALGRPVTLQLDGETFTLAGRPPLLRELRPGRHRIIVREGSRELERFDADVRAQNLFAALVEPRFYVYSVAGMGIYRRADLVYAVAEKDQDYGETLIAFERWIEQERADYLFTPAPNELTVGSGTKQRVAFDVAHDLGFRELAFAWYEQGRTADAARALRRNLELAPCDDGTRGDLVSMLDAIGDGERARAEATAWVSACDGSPAAHRAYQDLVLREGARAPLLATYRVRAEREPSAVNHYLYGRLLHGHAALAQHEAALRLDPKFVRARVALGHELLKLERDADAFEVLAESLQAEEVDPDAALYLALAAVATGKQDAARAKLVAAERHDTWQARWIVARSKGDWQSARVSIADKEQGTRTRETKLLHARLDWESGGVRESILADLRNGDDTADAAPAFALEDLLESGRAAEAVALDETLRANGDATLLSVYTLQAAMLAKLPDVAEKAGVLRAELQDEPFLSMLLDAAEGRIDEAALRERIGAYDVREHAHGWYALAVRAAVSGDREGAARLFAKASQRALDRELPHRLAALQAERLR